MGSMLCPVLISRDAELGALIAGLDQAANGDGSMLFLTGDPGVGKTRLATEIFDLAASRSFNVVAGRAVQSAEPVPFRPIIEALMRIARTSGIPDSPAIADYRPALASLVPEWGQAEAHEPEISPLILGEAVLRLLTLPEHTNTLLVLEDLHWADPETLAIVEYLIDNLAGRHILAVATLRGAEPSAGLDLVRSMQARRAAAVVEVPRLTEQEVGQMAAACLQTDEVPRAVTSGMLADCDGLPFAIEEILAAATASGELVHRDAGWQINEDVSTGIPASIVGSVRKRMAALGRECKYVIVAAAVLGKHFDWTLLPSVAGVTEPEVLTALQQARDLQLIEPVTIGPFNLRFRHALTRDAIISDLLPPDLARRSATAAIAIEKAYPGLPGTWRELAAELYAAAGQPVQAAGLGLASGRAALLQGALVSAITTLRHARNLLATGPQGDPVLAMEIDEELVKALELSGDYDQLVAVADHLIAMLQSAGADPRREALIRLRAARTRPEDHPAEAAAHLSKAHAIAVRSQDTALVSQIDAVTARCALDAGDLDGAEKLASQSLAAAEAAGLRGWAADVAFEALEVIGRRERGRDLTAARAAFDRATQIAEDNSGFAIRRITVLHELGTIDMLENGCTRRLSEALDLAHQAGAISTATIIELQLANAWSVGDDLERAMAAAQHCEQAASRIKAHRVEAMAIYAQAFVSGLRGDRQQTRLTAERAERVLPGDPEVLFSTWGQARVVASLFHDDLTRSLRESRTGMSHGERTPQNAPRRAWGFHALLEATGGTEGRAAISKARAAGADVGWNRGWLWYAEAVLEGREGRPERASALADQAASQFGTYSPRWNQIALRLISPAALADGWGQPVGWLRAAASEFEALGYDRLASACRGILRRAGERVPRSGRGVAQVPIQMRRLGITSREMDVFLLVARGCSNAEIASRLYISPKTVETHIASLVAKTGQHGRRELVAHAASFNPPPS